MFVTLCYPVTAGMARLQPSFAYTEETGFMTFFLYMLIKNHVAIFLL